MNRKYDSKKKGEEPDANKALMTDCGGNPMPNNVTPTRPPLAAAQARVLLSGLSVFCFNPAGARAEIGFIKEMHTDLKMEIYRNGTAAPIWSTANSTQFPFPNTKNITIDINSSETGIGSRYEENPLDKPEDFRRMPSLRYWHGKRLGLKGNAKAFLTARINVMNAIFYTYRLSTSQAIEHKKIKPNGPTLSANVGVVGRIMGGDILSNDSHLVIDYKVHNQTRQISFPNGAGIQYTIVLTTVADDHGHGHLKHVYDNILDNQDDYEYNLEFSPREKLWRYKIFGVRSRNLYYTEFPQDLTESEAATVEAFDTIEEAKAHGYTAAENEDSVQFACECFEGNCPPLSNIP